MKHRFSAMWSDKLGMALKEQCTKPYEMDLVHEDAQAVLEAVNQGIDSHLEACFVPDRGDFYGGYTPEGIRGKVSGSRLKCAVSPESLPVLVRRLMESENESATSLASSICETLDIELI